MYNELDPGWSKAKQELWRLLTCPIDWDSICDYDEFRYRLRFYWYAGLARHEIDRELRWSFDRDLIEPSEVAFEQMKDEEAEVDIRRLLTYRAAAERSYTKQMRRFTHLQPASSAEYGKHFANVDASDDDVAALSRGGEGILYPRFSLKLQRSIAWRVLEARVLQELDDVHRTELFRSPVDTVNCMDTALSSHRQIVHARLGRELGCANGRPTSFACFDFDFSTPMFHVYPESEKEHNSGQQKVYVSDADWAAWDPNWVSSSSPKPRPPVA